MKKLILIPAFVLLTGCAVVDHVKQYWPRSHDPVMFDHLVRVHIEIDKVNCDNQDWLIAKSAAKQLALYAKWRQDPQQANLEGLRAHTERMSKGGSKVFCEMGKKTAAQRIDAARTAWEGR